MKRAFALCVVIAAVAASAALAALDGYAGKVDAGGRVSLDARSNREAIKGVRHLSFEDIKVTCDSGPELYSPHFDYEIPVHKDAFHIAGPSSSGGTVAVRGAFNRSGRRVSGTIEAHGDLTAGNNCDGEHEWSAKRG